MTDDSELALSLAYGLLEGDGNLNLNLIAKNYILWLKSNPFDIGNTTRNAFGTKK